jgi:hypothetical protein
LELETKQFKKTHWTQSKYLYYGILLFWLLINLLQAGFTELIHDEAYYYYYSTDLAWGYFDHPPMIALFIKVGTLLTTNELGVRLIICLSSVIALALVIKIAEVKNYLLFFVLWFSVLIIHVGGFIAVPDVPLIFFSTVFFILYRNYLEKDNWLNTLLLSITIAALFYSKYTGVLVVFFTVLSNLKLLKQKSFWIIVAIASILMIPHLIWQVKHDFVTLYYHLVERSAAFTFKWQSVYEFILGQIGVLNPLIALILIYFGLIFKPKDAFYRSLKYNAFGVLFIGFIMSFRGHVEANWTSTAFIPLIIIAFQGIRNRRKVIKAIYIIGIISGLCILALRGIMMVNYLPEEYKHHFRVEFHNWDTWAEELHEKAGNKPVVFVNSYQRASKYLYYANKNTFTYNSLLYRKNQFDIGRVEQGLQGREVVLFNNERGFWINNETSFPIPEQDSIEISTREKVYVTNIKNYRTYNFLEIDIDLEEHEYTANTEIDIPITIKNPLGKPVTILSDSLNSVIAVAIFQRGDVVLYKEVEDISGLTIDKKYQTNLKLKLPEVTGKCYMRVVIRSGWLPPGLNSRIQKITLID